MNSLAINEQINGEIITEEILPQSPSQELIRTLAEKNIHLRLILAPPRSASSLTCASLSRSPSVGLPLHEPSHRAKKDGNPETLHADILAGLSDMTNTTIVIKDMAHWIAKSGGLDALRNIVEDPILILTRDPALTAESRLIKVLQIPMLKDRPEFAEFLEKEGFGKYNGDLNSQITQLNAFAQAHGFISWLAMIEKAKITRNYPEHIERVLKILRECKHYDNKSSGWTDLLKQYRALKQAGRKFAVLETADLSIAPKEYIKRLCELWNLDYCPEMVSWGTGGMETYATNQDRPDQKIWYNNLMKSKDIKPPKKAPDLATLPRIVQEDIIQDFLCYREIASSSQRILDLDVVRRTGFMESMEELQPNYTHVVRRFTSDTFLNQ